jgi:WD40 repeat protein
MCDSDVSIYSKDRRRRKAFSIPKLKSACLSPDGKYFGGVDDKIHVWDSMSGKEVVALEAEVKFLNFTSDSSAVIYATADKLVVWDVGGNRERFAVPLGAQREVLMAKCTQDGRILATAERQGGADGNERQIVAVYDLQHPEPVHVFAGHRSSIMRLAITRDGRRLASSSLDGVVKVWDLAAATAALSQQSQ